MRHLRTTITPILIAALLLGGFGLAQTHARPGLPAGAGGRAGVPALLGTHLTGLPPFAGLPIGTTVEIAFHDGDPAVGAAAVTTMSLTIGVDSEVAFAEAFAVAREEAAAWDDGFLVVTTGEQTRTVTLDDGADTDAATRRWRRDGALRLSTVGMSEGDTVGVTLYAGDPDAGGTVLEALSFAYGVDSEIGFRDALRAAAADADAAVVVTSPRRVTIDLAAMQARMTGLRDRFDPRGAALEPRRRPDAPRRLLPGRTR